ncbi:MAG: hypothetical protein ACOYBJ_01400 [Patescibacteria group bacterium]|jgi:hypothetical protein
MDAVAGGTSFGIGALFGRAWQIFRARFWTIFGILVVPSSVSLIGQLLAGEEFDGPQPLLGFALILVGALWGIWAAGAALEVITHPSEDVDYVSAHRRILPRLLGFILTSILVSLATLLGFVLFIIPGVLVAVWYSLSIYVYFAERTGVFEAMSRSKAYVTGYWWAVFGRNLLLGLVVMLVAASAGVAGSIILMVVFGADAPVSAVLASLFFVFLMTAISVYGYAYAYALYEALRTLWGGAAGVSIATTQPSTEGSVAVKSE